MANLVGTDVADPLLLGSEGSDTVNGLGGDDVIIALGGDDLVLGDRGNDDINGNRGNDVVNGGPGDDIFVRGGRENDLVDGGDGNDRHVNGNIGDDTVRGGLGNDSVYGGQDNDLVFGDGGNDFVSGDKGNDTLSGGEGTDTLTGGTGSDIFVLQQGQGLDIITDFEPDVDVIELPDGLRPLEEIEFSRIGVNEESLLITVASTGENLALVNNVPFGTISTDDFNNGQETVRFIDDVVPTGVTPTVTPIDEPEGIIPLIPGFGDPPSPVFI